MHPTHTPYDASIIRGTRWWWWPTLCFEVTSGLSFWYFRGTSERFIHVIIGRGSPDSPSQAHGSFADAADVLYFVVQLIPNILRTVSTTETLTDKRKNGTGLSEGFFLVVLACGPSCEEVYAIP